MATMDANQTSNTMHAGEKRTMEASREPKRTRNDSPHSENAWASLPLVAMELLFSFAHVDLSVQINPIPMQHQRAVLRHVPDAFSLRKLSAVCQDWRDAIEQLIAQHQVATVPLDFILKDVEELPEKLATHMTPKRHMILDLRVSIYRHISTSINPTLPAIKWDKILARCINLHRLDLSGMNCFKYAEMHPVLDAASLACPKLRALVFPLPFAWVRNVCLSPYERRRPPTDDDPFSFSSLATALERWHRAGGASGSSLRQLVLPVDSTDANEFLQLVTKFAPRMELLDAWKLAYFDDGYGDVRSDEHWHVDTATWESFCTTCVHLRDFNWGAVPFTDTFMAPFAKTKKWQLKEFTLHFTHCSSRNFNPVIDDVQARIRRSLGVPPAPIQPVTSLSLSSLARALPRLEVLRINLQSQRDMKLDAFDDDFLVNLARACPSLTTLFIAGGRGYTSTQSLEKISDRGLQALGTLANLTELALRPLQGIDDCSIAKLIGSSRERVQLDAKLMLPPRASRAILKSVIENVATAINDLGGNSERAFAVQIAIQEPKERIQYRADGAKPAQYAKTAVETRKFLESLRMVRNILTGTQSRLRFQVVVDEYTQKLTQISLFTTNWVPRTGIHALFLPNEIPYDKTQDDTFEWIVAY